MAERASGPSYTVPRLASELVQTGVDASVWALGSGVPISHSNLEVITYPPSQSIPILDQMIGRSSSMRSALIRASEGIDIIHTHGLWRMSNVYAMNVGSTASPIKVLSPRGMLSPVALEYSASMKKIFWQAVQKRAAQSASMLHVTSAQELADCRKAGLFQPAALIPNGIDLPDRNENTEASGLRDLGGGRTLLFLGRVHPIKNVELLLNCWAEIEALFPDWHLKIVGPGEHSYLSRLNHIVVRKQIQRVTFEGAAYGADKNDYFRSADLYILPSNSENFGVTVAESLINSTPVITMRGTPWAAVADIGCGWWIECIASSLQATLVDAMSLSKTELSRMGEVGAQWAEGEFAWSEIASKMSAAYRWLLGEGNKPDFVYLD